MLALSAPVGALAGLSLPLATVASSVAGALPEGVQAVAVQAFRHAVRLLTAAQAAPLPLRAAIALFGALWAAL